MSYPPYESEEWMACGPMFVEDGDGFALTDEARAWLALMDGVQPDRPTPPTVIERVAAVRAELVALAAEMPAAARVMSPSDVLDVVGAVQECTNLLGSVDQAVVVELDRLDVRERWGATSTADLLVQQLRVRPAEAKRRVFTARTCTPRTSLDGQALPPERPFVAEAQASGTISSDHAHVIARVLASFPVSVPAVEVEAVERSLVELAGKRHPSDVALVGRAARDMFDPDGPQAA